VLAELTGPTEEELAAVTRQLSSYKPPPMPAYLAARVEQAIAIEAAGPRAQDNDDDEEWRERLSKIPPPRPPLPNSRATRQRSGR
jgi:hypothetical protein